MMRNIAIQRCVFACHGTAETNIPNCNVATVYRTNLNVRLLRNVQAVSRYTTNWHIADDIVAVMDV